MDTEGARALARRIAEGKPPAEAGSAEHVAQWSTRSAAESVGAAPLERDGVLYIHPRPLRGPQRVWIYVRGPAGRLRRVL
jgi:hypothetical protein